MKKKIITLALLTLFLLGISVYHKKKIQAYLLSISSWLNLCSSEAPDESKVKTLNRRIEALRNELIWKENKLFEANTRLAKYVVFKKTLPILPYAVVHTELCGEIPSRIQRKFIINRGANSGVTPKCPAVWGKALVGITDEVSPVSSIVKHITDPSVNIPVIIINKDRSRGMIEGAGVSKDLCLLKYIPADVSVHIGDNVVTSGIGGVYPKGLVVGSIVKFDRPRHMYYSIKVKPAVRFNSIEEAFILVKSD